MTDRPMPPGFSAGRDDMPASLMDGRYRIERPIGEGAFGRVYLAFDTRLRRNVAIKELLASRGRADADLYARYLERFQREARAAGVVLHPNIVAVLELAIDRDENHYLVMEYIDGTDLRNLLAQVGTLPVERAVRITLDVARALEAVHEQDIVHRDLKPANIMLTRRGVTKLTDFGVAQVGHESMRTQIASGHPGTPLYMSPEQGSGAGYIDGRSDLYSLGLVLYEMLVGKPYARRPQSLAVARPDASPELVAIFDRLIAKDAYARYADADEVVTALSSLSIAQRTLTSTDDLALPPTIAGRPRSGETSSQASASYQSLSSGASVADPYAASRSQSVSPVPSPVPSAESLAMPAAVSQSGAAPQVVSRVPKRRRGLSIGIGGAVVAIGIAIAVVVIGASLQTPTVPQAPTNTAIVSSTVAPTALQSQLAPGASTREPTVTPTPTLMPPTITQTAPPTRVTPTTGAGTDFSQWVTTEVAGMYRRSFDPTTGEYHVTVLKDNLVQPLFTPEVQSIADLTLEVDVRRVAGPDAGGFGVAFRVQPLNPGDKSRAAYVFVIDGQQRYALYELKSDGTSTFIQDFVALPTGAMHAGPNAVNHLAVTCRGDKITLTVNGTTLKTYSAAIAGPGTIGIALETPPGASGLEAAFRNLRVTRA